MKRRRKKVIPVHLCTLPSRVAEHPEAHWTERPVILKRRDGTCEVLGDTADLDAAARWVLGHGPTAEVVSPDVLRRKVARQAREIAERYE